MNRGKYLVALSLATLVGSASAVTVTGNGFSFSYGSTGHFGAVTAAGNVVHLSPGGSPGFTAETSENVVDSLSESKSFIVTALSGYRITGFSMRAAGYYFYFSEPTAKVEFEGGLTVNASSSALGAPASPFVELQAEDYNSAAPWSASTGTIATSFVASTPINVGLSLLLKATSPDSADPSVFNYAFIDAREVQLRVSTERIVSEIPEPAAGLMLLAGFGGVLVAGRRQRRSA